jgi:hypothetical protein
MSLEMWSRGNEIQISEDRFCPGNFVHFKIIFRAHPASYTMGTGCFPGVKRPGRGVDHPPLSSAEIKERIELHPYSHSEPSWPVLKRTFIFKAWTLIS